MISVASKKLRVLLGIHAGAELVIKPSRRYRLGSQPDCDIVLFDRHVAHKHCILKLDEKGFRCAAVDASLRVADRELSLRETMRINDFDVVQCGDAAFAIASLETTEAQWQALAQHVAHLQAHTTVEPNEPIIMRQSSVLTSRHWYHVPKRYHLPMVGSLLLVIAAGVYLWQKHYVALESSAVATQPMMMATPDSQPAVANLSITPVVAPQVIKNMLLTASATAAEVKHVLTQLNLPTHDIVANQVGGRWLVQVYLTEPIDEAAAQQALLAYQSALSVKFYQVNQLFDQIAAEAVKQSIHCKLQYAQQGQFRCQVYPDQAAKAARLQGVLRGISGINDVVVVVVPTPGLK